MSSPTRAALRFLVLGLVLVGGCGTDARPATSESPESATGTTAAPPIVTLTGHERARISEVLAERRGTAFSRSVVVKDNARVFLHLAETASDPDVAAAALRALLTTWTHNPRYASQLQLLTPDYARVLALRLDDERPAVQAGAMQASIKCLEGEAPDADIASHLVRLATDHATAAGRHEALEVLWNSSVIREHPEQIAPYVRALSAPEAWVVSAALFRLAAFGMAYSDQAALRATLLGLLHHEDPGVRGRAATTLSIVVGPQDPERDTVAQAIEPLLSDAHPFTRSAAATALAWLDFRPAVHALMPLLSDHARNTYDLGGYTRLDGTPGFVHHDGSPWSRVDDAVLRALQSFSARVGPRFSFDIQQDRLDESFAIAARTAREWYEAARGTLPQATVSVTP